MKLFLMIAGLCFPVMMSANIIFTQGKIYTVNSKQPWAEAIVIEDDKIIYVGSTAQALTYKNLHSHIIDLHHQFMMPGIIDSHTHTAIASLLLNNGVNLLEAKGKKNILDAIKNYAQKSKEEVITGFGFYPYVMGTDGPNAGQLDDIVPNRKAFIVSNNGHSAWVNTQALEYLNISANMKDPLPGMHYYARDAKGRPTGFLVEGEAFWPHFKKMGIATRQNFYRTLKSFLPKLSRQGITAIFDAGIPAVESNAFEAIQELEKDKLLPLRYFGSHYIVSEKDAKNALETFRATARKFNSALLQIATVKFSNDNSNDDHFAIQFNAQSLKKLLIPLIENDVDIMVHTSHDQSVHQSLDAIEKVKAVFPSSHSRVALAHVNMVRDSDFERFKKLHIIANIQPFNAQGDGYYEYRYMLYEDWENKLVRFKTFFDHNITVSASSDFPACNSSLDKCTPFDSMQIAMTRQKVGLDRDATILDNENEKLTIEQIIKAFTLNGAYQLHQEDTIGSLEKGKKADLIVLNQNLLETNSKKIYQTMVNLTMVNGKIVYERK